MKTYPLEGKLHDTWKNQSHYKSTKMPVSFYKMQDTFQINVTEDEDKKK